MDPQFAVPGVVLLAAGFPLTAAGFVWMARRRSRAMSWPRPSGLAASTIPEGILLLTGLIALVIGLVMILNAYAIAHEVHEPPALQCVPNQPCKPAA